MVFTSSIRISFTRMIESAAAPDAAEPPQRRWTPRGTASAGSKFRGSTALSVPPSEGLVQGFEQRDAPCVRLEGQHETVHDVAEADVLLRVRPAHCTAEAGVSEAVVR